MNTVCNNMIYIEFSESVCDNGSIILPGTSR